MTLPPEADAGTSGLLTRPGTWWIVASNAIPVVGVLFYGWNAFPLLVFYWIENVVTGAFNVPRILVSGFTKPGTAAMIAVPVALFFIVHYGLFCYVHGLFLIGILTIGELVNTGAEPQAGAFELTTTVWNALQRDPDLAWSVGFMIALQLAGFVVFWLGGKKWRDTDPMRQVFEPYGRVVALHLTIFIAAIPVIFLGSPMLAVLALALMKTGLELELPYFKLLTTPATGKPSSD